MGALIRTFRFLMKAQLRAPLFYIFFAVSLLCATIPMITGPSTEIGAVVCDRDNTALSRDLVRQAQEIATLRLEKTDPAKLTNALGSLRNGGVEAVFVIEKGYESRLQSGQYENVLSLYLSPYSTSARTLSDGVAALVMRQWLKLQVQGRAAEEIDDAAGDEAAQRFTAGSVPIIVLNVEGEANSGKTANPLERKIQNALLILAGLACFLILCFPETGGQDDEATMERYVSMGWHPSACLLARALLRTVPPAIAALLPCIAYVVSGGAERMLTYPVFLIYLLAWVGIASIMDAFVRNTAVRLTVGLIVSIFNAVLLFPQGLSQMIGPVRGIFAGYWFSSALQGSLLAVLLPLGVYTLAAITAGTALIEWKTRKR